ncbi:MAG: DUF3604 domain-containing protein [Parachlamydiaceae bacterium]
MRRSICYCEPSTASAGEVNNWLFFYTPSIDLPKGTKIKFDLQSQGRDIDWEIPSADLKKTSNIIYAKIDKHKEIPAKEVESPNSFTPSFEFILPVRLDAGKLFTITVGSQKSPKTNGNRAQAYSQRRRSFELYVDTTGKGKYEDPEVFTMDIRGNELVKIRVLTPSFVARNKRFDVVVRFEDEFGNLTNRAPEDTLVELSYEHLRENLSWKLFVPETGFIALPNLYFNEVGVYTIQLLNTKTKEIFRSSPIMCFAENPKHLFWGLPHGESDRIDSTENIENCLRHFRDDKALNFYASSPFESQEETSNETWKLISQNIADFDELDRFTTFLGFQWAGTPGEEGVRQIIHLKDGKHLLHRKDPKYSSLKKIYKTFTPKDILSIPCFTMGKGFDFNFKNYDPDFERVVEIYNSWGSSECTQKEGNELSISSPAKNGVKECAEGSIQKALLRNCRFGFVAGGLDDRGIYSDFYENGQEQYAPGLTAIIAMEHTRAAMAEALHNRSCYATTGERIIMGFSIAGVPMGGETTTAVKHGLRINRHLCGFVAGTCQLTKVELIRNGKVIKTLEPDSYSMEFTYDDMTPLEKVVIDAKDKKPPFVYYYVRVTQEDGHMAWSSPIWIDFVPVSPNARAAARRQLSKFSKKPALIEESEEEEEEEEEDDDFDDDFEE